MSRMTSNSLLQRRVASMSVRGYGSPPTRGRRNDVALITRTPPHSRRAFSREFCPQICALRFEGSRECRAPDAPAASHAKIKSIRVSHHGHAGFTRHSPRNGFNRLLRALPGDRAFLPPSSPRSLLPENLTPASGCQDHTASPSASRAFVNAPLASIASRPASVTIASRPLSETGRRE
jgi:hypothetical protein